MRARNVILVHFQILHRRAKRKLGPLWTCAWSWNTPIPLEPTPPNGSVGLAASMRTSLTMSEPEEVCRIIFLMFFVLSENIWIVRGFGRSFMKSIASSTQSIFSIGRIGPNICEINQSLAKTLYCSPPENTWINATEMMIIVHVNVALRVVQRMHEERAASSN